MNRSEIEKRVGRMAQLADVRRYVVDDGKGRGMRAFEVVNGSGFDFTVYPDRGLDVGPARYNGLPLTWTTRNGPVAPAFYDASAFEWLRSWPGGLVTTCGWLNVGGPCNTPEGAEGLHGRMDNTPAEEVNTRAYWEGGDYRLEVSGKICQCRVFGENFETVRTIRTKLGWAGLELVDRTTNRASTAMPFMQLYHMNFGWPFINEQTRLSAAEHAIVPQNARAAEGVAEWDRFPSPTKGFAEQVLYHDIPADAEGYCSIRVESPAFGLGAEARPVALTLSYRKAELPYLVQWRQAGEGDYVLGLEPANCHPEGQSQMAEKGLLRRLEPGETVESRIRVSVESIAVDGNR